MVGLDRERWTAVSLTGGHGAMRRLAVGVNLCVGVVAAAAPYLNPRPPGEQPLYAGTAAVVVAAALLLLTGERWPAWLVLLVAVAVPNGAVLVLLSQTSEAGLIPVLLVGSSLTAACYGTRMVATGNGVAVAVGLAAAATASPDPRLGWAVWVVTVVVCALSSASLRTTVERSDRIIRGLGERARRDTVTGLLNRRAFDDELDRLWADPEATPLAVLFCDLDHFKAVNDTYGHAAGDDVLRAFAEVLLAHVGPRDVVARTGGEEFGVLLPGRDGPTAQEWAQHVVTHLGRSDVAYADGTLRCTVSAGAAVRSSRHQVPSDLCRDADRALYAAKDSGRDRAVLSGH
ncbi:GGDEF domain-containing protein [Actinotalea sp. K2]|uniref:GGDEF domain-containing protein n=1 Tax=Actinotalea sp. K2 TaxID=2939438 RepID=UPI002018234C|nr:GGDEF domain-containing protein [Actinotalea sp. K2]MCL3862758.1 GGDEF domain-containing protein [Actinotalea sp. K2]